jgi:hypothetical protein
VDRDVTRVHRVLEQVGPRRHHAPPRGHIGNYINFILNGEIRCGDTVCGPGSHIMLEWGGLFGSWEACPDGCELYGFIAGDWFPFAGAAAPFEALLAERGARRVPIPLPTRVPQAGATACPRTTSPTGPIPRRDHCDVGS